MVTITTSALSRAEEIALAAEVRAFSPEHARSSPVRMMRWDWLALSLGVVSVLLFCADLAV